MTAELRRIVVDSLQKASGALDRAELHDRLRDPSADIALDELGLDSLTGIEWCMEIEQATGLELDPAVLGRAGTLSGLIAHVAARLPDR